MQQDHIGKSRLVDVARSVVTTDGPTGLWRGTGPTVLRNVPGVSMYFYVQARMRSALSALPYFQVDSASLHKQHLVTDKAKLTVFGNLLVGAIARGSVGIALMPLTTLKTVAESSLHMARLGTLGQIRHLYAQNGLYAFWRGSIATTLRDVPGAGLFIVFYEQISRSLDSPLMHSTRGSASTAMLGGALSAATASALSTVLTTPFDVLKTRRQLSPTSYHGIFSSALLIARERGGFRALWDGALLRIARKAGSSAVGWAVYEGFMMRSSY